MSRYLHLLSLILCMSVSPALRAADADSLLTAAEEARPLTSAYQVGAGHLSALSTYLTPQTHRGTSFSLAGSWGRDLRCKRYKLRQEYQASYAMGFLRDRAGLSAMTDISLQLAWNMQRGFSPLPSLRLGAGAGVQLAGGLLYLPRNSNNPVAARVSAFLTLNASVLCDFRLGRLPLRVIDKVSLPSLGVFFSPHYGQSYYEIYLGDDSGLARCGWWGNHFAVSNLVAVEVPVCGIRLRVGYGFDMLTSRASGLDTHLFGHQCVVGITTDWINVTRRK